MDIDDERWGQSGHEVPETTVNDEIECGAFNNQLGAEVLMKCRGGGLGGEDNMTAAMTTKSDVIDVRR